MDRQAFYSYKIEERSFLAFIKREIHNLATRSGFSSQKVGEIDIIVSELTSNLIKHAASGELIYRLISDNEAPYLELICMDSGPGTNHINRAMKDGISSTNTLGHGLGAIKRLSDFFQIYSQEDWGTVAYSKIYASSPSSTAPSKGLVDVKALQFCKPGETICGDGYYTKSLPNETHIFLGDGLGHGPHAHEAVETAIAAFIACKENNPVEILRHLHQHTKKTRGLVGSVAVINHAMRTWQIAGVGNITTRLYDGLSSKNYLPHNGIIGLNMPNTMKNYEVAVEKYQVLIMYSDGIKNRWDLSTYPTLIQFDPTLIASAIFKDQARKTDDMTIMVGKINL